MPANKKYLSHGWQRFAKVSAATVGGFLVSASFHLMLAAWVADRKAVLLTYSYTGFLVWCTLMLLAFLFKNGNRCWAWYGGVSLIFSLLTVWRLTS